MIKSNNVEQADWCFDGRLHWVRRGSPTMLKPHTVLYDPEQHQGMQRIGPKRKEHNRNDF
jgi:hypothetical protein